MTRSEVSCRCAERDRCMYALICISAYTHTPTLVHEYWDWCKRRKYTQIHHTPILYPMELINLIINDLNHQTLVKYRPCPDCVKITIILLPAKNLPTNHTPTGNIFQANISRNLSRNSTTSSSLNFPQKPTKRSFDTVRN